MLLLKPRTARLAGAPHLHRAQHVAEHRALLPLLRFGPVLIPVCGQSPERVSQRLHVFVKEVLRREKRLGSVCPRGPGPRPLPEQPQLRTGHHENLRGLGPGTTPKPNPEPRQGETLRWPGTSPCERARRLRQTCCAPTGDTLPGFGGSGSQTHVDQCSFYPLSPQAQRGSPQFRVF